jgi:hypothetical protein
MANAKSRHGAGGGKNGGRNGGNGGASNGPRKKAVVMKRTRVPAGKLAYLKSVAAQASAQASPGAGTVAGGGGKK